MFCPNCLAEYVEGIKKCSDCNVDLVKELHKPKEEPLPEFVEYEEVLTTYNPVDIAMIHSMLDGQNIDFFFHSEWINSVQPVTMPSRLMVRKGQVEIVKTLLKDLDIRFMIPFK